MVDLTPNVETRCRCSTEPCRPCSGRASHLQTHQTWRSKFPSDHAKCSSSQTQPSGIKPGLTCTKSSTSKPTSRLVPSPRQQLLPPAKAAFHPIDHQTHSHPSLSATTAGEEVVSTPQAAVRPWWAPHWPNPAFLFLLTQAHAGWHSTSPCAGLLSIIPFLLGTSWRNFSGGGAHHEPKPLCNAELEPCSWRNILGASLHHLTWTSLVSAWALPPNLMLVRAAA